VNPRPLAWWGVAALIALIWAATNLPWHLDDYDQAKQAFTSYEMLHEGAWLHQHTPNERVATKPPLVGWISAAVYGVTRSWEAAWRLPSFAAAVAVLVVLTRSATTSYGMAAGFVAMAAFGLNLLSARLATLVRTDMPLALVVFLLGWMIWRKVRAGEAWLPRERAVMFALLTAAMLVKGPIVYAFLLPGVVAFEFWRRRSGFAVSAWCGWWPWIVSLAVFGAWVAAGVAWMPGFYEEVVLKEFAGRFSDTVHRAQPFYFYIPHLLHKFAPWSVVLLGCCWLHRRGRMSPEVAWLVFWSLGGLLVMSLVPSKRVDRIFPVIPPLCLLLATQVPAISRRWITAAVVFACVFTSGYAAHRVWRAYSQDRGALKRFAAEVRQQHNDVEVIGGRDEGLLLYLRKTRFAQREEVIARWSAGELHAVVAPAGELLLPDSAVAKQARGYVLLVRTGR
jgi:4-amino-4-deoxy-L-arabinose transferase-like glycosyltransferase